MAFRITGRCKLGSRKLGTENWEPKTESQGNRKLGTDCREREAGNRELGAENCEPKTETENCEPKHQEPRAGTEN